MNDPMKYYIYISDAKLDMFYSQIPKGPLKSIASELNINLNILGTGVGAAIKSSQSEETRYSKLKLVTRYIEKHHGVGTVDSPRAYFKGVLEMEWGQMFENETRPEMVLFRGETDTTFLVLGGSPQHLVGSQQTALSQRTSWMLLSGALLLSALREDIYPTDLDQKIDLIAQRKVVDVSPGTVQGVEDIVVELSHPQTSSRSPWPQQRFEFLARKLFHGPSEVRKHTDRPLLLLGTPIYVALSDY